MRHLAIVGASLFALFVAACGGPVDTGAGDDPLRAEKEKPKHDSGCEPPPPPDSGPSECTKARQGSDSSCKPADTWKSYAYADCESQGKTLSSYVLSDDCGGGAYRYVDYTCCSVDAGPPPDSGPVDDGAIDGGPAACIGAVQGGETSCKSAETWKSYAAADCASTGRVLTEHAVGEPCGVDSYRYVKYACCLPDPSLDAGASCPANPTDWAIGTPCTEPLLCNYKDACGNIDQFHCKEGKWQVNTWTYCPGKPY